MRVAAVLLLVLMSRLQLLGTWPLFVDEANNYATATRVNETRGRLYRDAWEQKPPLLLGTLVAVRSLVGPADAAAFHRIEHAIALIAVALLATLVAWSPATGLVAALGGTALFALAAASSAETAWLGHELFMAPLLIAALSIAGRGPRSLVWSALLVGIAACAKPNVLVLGAPIAIEILAGRESLLRRLGFGMAAVTMLALPLAAVVAWYTAVGAFSDLWHCLVVINLQYVAQTGHGTLVGYTFRAPFVAALLTLLGAAAIALGRNLLARDLAAKPAHLRRTAGWIACLLLATLPGQAKLHYALMPLAVGAALPAALAAHIVGQPPSRRTRRALSALVLAGAAATLVADAPRFVRYQARLARGDEPLGPERKAFLAVIAREVLARTRPGEAVYVHGSYAEIYGILADRRLASRNPGVAYFGHPQWRGRYLSSLALDLEQEAPSVVVDMSQVPRWECFVPLTGNPLLKAWLERCDMVEVAPGVRLYELRRGSRQ